MIRVNVPLEQPEAAALIDLARESLRHPRDQVRYLLREALIARGLLPAATDPARPALPEVPQ